MASEPRCPARLRSQQNPLMRSALCNHRPAGRHHSRPHRVPKKHQPGCPDRWQVQPGEQSLGPEFRCCFRCAVQDPVARCGHPPVAPRCNSGLHPADELAGCCCCCLSLTSGRPHIAPSPKALEVPNKRGTPPDPHMRAFSQHECCVRADF